MEFWKSLGPAQTFLAVTPFVAMLLCIAVLPLVAPHWWHKNRNKAVIASLLGAPVAGFMAAHDRHALAHAALEYATFIALLGALYVISGCIHIRAGFRAAPAVNTGVLALGALLANLIGTTGASMLLIRPLLRANRHRRHQAHVVVFFIFLVANCGGCLTPLGDPPLFLGFLQGVPFAWTLHLAPMWFVVVASLLAVFYAIDFFLIRREPPAPEPLREFRIEGARNAVFLLGVIGTILLSGYVVYPRFGELRANLLQISLLTIFAAVAYRTTPDRVRAANGFTWSPIIEVAVLFAGIFASMIPPLQILQSRGAELGVDKPWQFFWLTGVLSGFLDNAPTYLTFASLAKGTLGLSHSGLAELAATEAGRPFLIAVSLGAVFMGASTYVGNGPNFMVKAVAEEAGVKMPGFFGYMLWSTAALMPLMIGVTLLFLR